MRNRQSFLHMAVVIQLCVTWRQLTKISAINENIFKLPVLFEFSASSDYEK